MSKLYRPKNYRLSAKELIPHQAPIKSNIVPAWMTLKSFILRITGRVLPQELYWLLNSSKEKKVFLV